MVKSSFDALAQVLNVLKELNIQYMLVGSFSSNAYSYPRATNDADIELNYVDGDLSRIRERLDGDFVINSQMSFELITGTVRNILTFQPTKFDIELFRLGDDPHHQERFRRRRPMTISSLGIEATIPTAEDVVIQKVRWQRSKDIIDSKLVIQIQASLLDWSYIHRWTDKHGTTSLVEQLRREELT